MIRQTTYLEPEVLHDVLDVLYREINELMRQLAPEGWSNSPYHFPFELVEGEQEIIQERYDTVARAYERKFGNLLRQYISHGRYEIDYMTRLGGSHQSTSEFIYLLSMVIVQLTINGRLFKVDDDSVHYIIDCVDVAEESLQLSMDLMLPIIDDVCDLVLTDARKNLVLYIGLSPLYAQVFAAFRRAGYDWVYRDEYLMDLWEMIQTYDSTESHPLPFSDKYTKHLSSLINKARSEMPPEAVLGYFEAYERWPQGYPPTQESLHVLQEVIVL